MTSRQQTHFELSTRLSLMDDRKLVALLKQAEATTGWGSNRTLTVDGKKVFAKSVPLTDREYKNAYSTRNHYQLPLFYNYGVGSAGFGVFRELAFHVKTTNWVLGGASETFPLMYHHRILLSTGRPRPMDGERLDAYVKTWNGSKRIRSYILDRRAASHEVVIFLEHIPEVMFDWLGGHSAKVRKLIAVMQKTLGFLQANGIVHFDAHPSNILMQGDKPFLADFGLVLDREFDLSEREQKFLRDHRHYDSGEFLHGLVHPLYAQAQEWDQTKRDAFKQRYRRFGVAIVLENLAALIEGGFFQLHPSHSAALVQYREPILMIDEFFTALRSSPKKNTPFSDRKLQRLLRRAYGAAPC